VKYCNSLGQDDGVPISKKVNSFGRRAAVVDLGLGAVSSSSKIRPTEKSPPAIVTVAIPCVYPEGLGPSLSGSPKAVSASRTVMPQRKSNTSALAGCKLNVAAMQKAPKNLNAVKA
jgi:hypothetical protein